MAEVQTKKSTKQRSNSLVPSSGEGSFQHFKVTSYFFAIFAPAVIDAVYRTVIYTEYLGANVSFVAFFLFIYAIVGIANPLYLGTCMDTWRPCKTSIFPVEKCGKRTPWLILMTPGFLISTWMMWNPPASMLTIKKATGGSAGCFDSALTIDSNVTIDACATKATTSGPGMQVGALELWMLFTFLLFIHFNNAQNLTFYASLPEIYPNPDERASVGVCIGIFNNIGALVIVLLISIVFLRDEWNGVGACLVCTIMWVVTFYPGLSKIKQANGESKARENCCTTFMDVMKTSSSMRIFLLSHFFKSATNALNLVFLPYFLVRSIGMCPSEWGQVYTLGAAVRLLLGVAFLPFWKWILVTKKIHPRISTGLYSIIHAPLNMILGYAANRQNAMLIVGVVLSGLVGINYSQDNIGNNMFRGWCVDEDTVLRYRRDGQIVRRESTIQGAYDTTGRLTLFWVAIWFSGLAGTGYDGTVSNACQPAEVSSYVTICAIVIPSITTFIRGVIILFYPLHGDRLEKLEKDLNEINVKDGKYKIPEKDSAQETIVTTVGPKFTAQETIVTTVDK